MMGHPQEHYKYKNFPLTKIEMPSQIIPKQIGTSGILALFVRLTSQLQCPQKEPENPPPRLRPRPKEK